MDKTADKIKEIITNNDRIAVLSDTNVVREIGLNGIRAEHIAYDIEEKYGYSNDEIATEAFFSRRTDMFYDYIKNIVINIEDPQPSVVHKAVRQLQQRGKQVDIVTRTIYELYGKAECENVINLHGSIEKNTCPNCGKVFGMKYLKQAKDIPVCDSCGVPIRPGFVLFGERVNNGRVTEACNAVESADVVLALGTSVRNPLCQYLMKYYTRNKFILINTEEMHGDERADYRIYGNLSELVAYVTGYDPKAVFLKEKIKKEVKKVEKKMDEAKKKASAKAGKKESGKNVPGKKASEKK